MRQASRQAAGRIVRALGFHKRWGTHLDARSQRGLEDEVVEASLLGTSGYCYLEFESLPYHSVVAADMHWFTSIGR